MTYKTQTQVTSLNRFVVPTKRISASASSYSSRFGQQQLNDSGIYPQRREHRFFDANGRINRFDGSLNEFDALPIARRLHWIRQFMKQVPSANRWFNNIAGIIEGFVQYGLAEPSSWLSIVDAVILQGIQDGYARSAGLVAAPSVNPGARFWRQFFDALGSHTHDLERINLWGCAETAATNTIVRMVPMTINRVFDFKPVSLVFSAPGTGRRSCNDRCWFMFCSIFPDKCQGGFYSSVRRYLVTKMCRCVTSSSNCLIFRMVAL